MILVISNWKKKMLYLICAAVVIVALAVMVTSGGQEPVDAPPAEEQPADSNFDGGVEKVTKDEDVQDNNGDLEGDQQEGVEESQEIVPKEETKNLNIEPSENQEAQPKINEEKESSWLKSLIEKFKAEK